MTCVSPGGNAPLTVDYGAGRSVHERSGAPAQRGVTPPIGPGTQRGNHEHDRDDGDDAAAEHLDEAYAAAKNIQQPAARVVLFNEIAKRFCDGGETEKARRAAVENLQIVQQIRDESQRAVALLRLAETFEFCGFQMNDEERQIVGALLR